MFSKISTDLNCDHSTEYSSTSQLLPQEKMDIASLVNTLNGLQINSVDDFEDTESKIREVLLVKWENLKAPPPVLLKAKVSSAATIDVNARLAKYKKINPNTEVAGLKVHYYDMIKKFEHTFGHFYRCPGSCSPTSPQDATAFCPNYQRINWEIESGSPFSPFIFDHWYKQEDIAKSINHALLVLARRIVQTLSYEWEFAEIETFWGEHTDIVSHMKSWCKKSDSYDAHCKNIVTRIKTIHNSIPTEDLKLWIKDPPKPEPIKDHNETLSQISERVFNLLHSDTHVNVTLYIQDKFCMTGKQKNIVLRCASCDTAGKTNHPECNKKRYVVEYNQLFEDDYENEEDN